MMIAPTSSATTTSITDGTTFMTIAHDTTGVLIDTATGVLIDTTAMKTAMLAIAMLAIALLLSVIVVIVLGIGPKPSPRIPGNIFLLPRFVCRCPVPRLPQGCIGGMCSDCCHSKRLFVQFLVILSCICSLAPWFVQLRDPFVTEVTLEVVGAYASPPALLAAEAGVSRRSGGVSWSLASCGHDIL